LQRKKKNDINQYALCKKCAKLYATKYICIEYAKIMKIMQTARITLKANVRIIQELCTMCKNYKRYSKKYARIRLCTCINDVLKMITRRTD